MDWTDTVGSRPDGDRRERGELIATLENIQRRHGYLPQEALREVADRSGRPLVDVYGVATFYRAFSLKPKGKHVLCVCLGTACHVRGAPQVVEEFERQLGVSRGETTPDGEFSLETVNCLGACALGPIVVADGRYFSQVTSPKVRGILETVRKGSDVPDPQRDERMFALSIACPRCKRSLLDAGELIDGHPSVHLLAVWNGTRKSLRLSSLYGSASVVGDEGVVEGTVVQLVCPHCQTELPSRSTCFECEAPMALMTVKNGSAMEVCSRHGCKHRMLSLAVPPG